MAKKENDMNDTEKLEEQSKERKTHRKSGIILLHNVVVPGPFSEEEYVGQNDERARARVFELEWIRTLAVFAAMTGARTLAKLIEDDEEKPVYNLWFAFSDDESKRAFMGMANTARANGFCDEMDDELFLVEAETAPDDLQLWITVFPKADALLLCCGVQDSGRVKTLGDLKKRHLQ